MTDGRTGGKQPCTPKHLVRCRRTEQDLSVEEHAQCPYCFGRAADIETGDHARFCDYEAGKDPVNFGFPEDGARYDRT